MPRNSDTLSILPDKRDELEKLSEYLTTGGNATGIKPEWITLWDRIKAADGIMRNYVSNSQQLQKISKHVLFVGLSRTQIWRYRDAVQEIYGATQGGNKRYKRLIADELIQKGFKLAKSQKT